MRTYWKIAIIIIVLLAVFCIQIIPKSSVIVVEEFPHQKIDYVPIRIENVTGNVTIIGYLLEEKIPSGKTSLIYRYVADDFGNKIALYFGVTKAEYLVLFNNISAEPYAITGKLSTSLDVKSITPSQREIFRVYTTTITVSSIVTTPGRVMFNVSRLGW